MQYFILLQKISKCQMGKQKYLNWINRSNVHTYPAPVTVLSEEEEALRRSVAKIANEQIAPNVRKMEQECKISDDVLEVIRSNGLLGIEVPQEYGGSGCSFLMVALTIEEISKVDPAIAVLVDIQNTLITKLISKIGTKDQKEKYLPKLATRSIGSFCLSEATSGSDAFSLRTTAIKENNYYLINGAKMWISNSDVADIFLIMANVDPEKGYKGITCFIGEKDFPGLTVGKKESKLGLKASGTHTVYFDNYKVPEENVLGEIGQGYKYTINFLNEGRIGIGAQMLGLVEGCFNCTVPYLMERKQFGQPLINFQAIQHQISRMATEIETAKLMVYNSARLVDAKKSFIKESAMTKYYCAEKSNDTESDVSSEEDLSATWEDFCSCTECFKYQKSFPYTQADPNPLQDTALTDPKDFFNILVNDDVINLIVQETNRYAIQQGTSSRWTNVTNKEIEVFLALLLWMGLCRRPDFRNY